MPMRIQNNPILYLFLLTLFSFSASYSQTSFDIFTITNDFPRATDAYPIDIDNDGDIDIVGASAENNEISWWENDGEQNFTKHFVSNNLGWARTAIAVDLDNDNDIDIAGAGWDPGSVLWWENDGNQNFTEHIVDDSFEGSHTVASEDIDSDGDMDLLCGAYRNSTGEIAWWENDGEENFTKHTISDKRDRNACNDPVDVDSDGDIDIIGVGYMLGDVSWWENDGEENFTEHKIDQTFSGAHWTQGRDLDNDGDIDILGAAYNISSFAWWENDGNQNFTKHILDNSWRGSAWIYSEDMDNDGDYDILGVAENSNAILLWKNDGEGNFETTSVVTGFSGAFSAYPADMDNDGDFDVISAASGSNRICWFESDFYKLRFKAEVPSGHAPFNVQFLDLSTSLIPMTSWAWDFNNDGTVDSQEKNPEWTYNEPGIYSVQLEIANDSTSTKMLFENYIHVFNGESALLFDGVDSYIACPASSSLNLTNRMTIEAKIKPRGWGENLALGFGRIIDKQKIAAYLINSSPVFNDHSLTVSLAHNDGSTSISMTPENSITLDEWQHIAVSYDGAISELKIYINGIEQALTHTNSPSGEIADNNTIDLLIGNNSGRSFAFDGVIDDIRIWDTIRARQDIRNNINEYPDSNETGLVGYWDMNEASGEEIQDKSNNSNNGIVTGAAWIQGAPLTLPTSIKKSELTNEKAENFTLLKNYPNPFNPTTTITFSLLKQGNVSLKIYNIKGELVRTLLEGKQASGIHSIPWDGKDNQGNNVSSGCYLCKMDIANYSKINKMALVR